MGLTVFSELECKGSKQELKESIMDISLTQVGVNFPVKSAIVEGNPWTLFSNIRYDGFLSCLEEGTHEDLTKLRSAISSVKCMVLTPGQPHALVFNSSVFKEDVSWWNYGDQDRYICMETGGAGVWAVQGSKLLQRVESGFGLGLKGSGWRTVMDSGVKQVSVGDSIVWVVTKDNKFKIKSGLTASSIPAGTDWHQLDADFGEINNCSVGPNGVVWTTDIKGKVYRRMGAKATNPMGTKWQPVDGELSLVSVGNSGVWGITPKQVVMYREGTYGLSTDSDGRGWTKINGKMNWISSGHDIVWATSSNGSLWYRGGISTTNPAGNNWFRVAFPDGIKDFHWSKVSGGGDGLIGLNNDGLVIGTDTALSQHLIDGEGVSVYEGEENFTNYLVNQQPSNIEVLAGAWVAFTNKNYKGTCFYHFEDETISNDPLEDGEDFLKSWQLPIGSIRPLDHDKFKSIEIVNVAINWDNVNIRLEQRTLDELEDTNDDPSEYKTPSWPRISNYDVTLSHRFEMNEIVPGLQEGAQVFRVANVPKTNFSYVSEDGSKFETKQEFRQELSGTFTFLASKYTERERKRTEVVRLPPVLEPNCQKKICLICQELIIEAPFTITLRKGLKIWDVAGAYTGKDGTTIKLSYKDTDLAKPANRENGLNGH